MNAENQTRTFVCKVCPKPCVLILSADDISSSPMCPYARMFSWVEHGGTMESDKVYKTCCTATVNWDKALEAMRSGKRVKRLNWGPLDGLLYIGSCSFRKTNNGGDIDIRLSDINATDWVIEEESHD